MLQLEIIGNIGQDAEVKTINGKTFVAFNVAHSERQKETQTTVTTWVSVLWHGDGGGLTQYLTKGKQVFVRGRMSVKTYQSNGQIYPAVNVIASEVQLCGTKNDNQ